MAAFNKVILMGNLTRDPELAATRTAGTAVCNFGIASTRRWRADDGTEREETYFGEVKAFGRMAEIIASNLKKGRPVLVEGRLALDQWEDRETGKKRSSTRIICEAFQFIGPNPNSQPA